MIVDGGTSTILHQPPPTITDLPSLRDLRLLSPPNARDAPGPAMPAARRLDGGGAVAMGRAARGALVGELRGRPPHRPHRRGSYHVAGMARLRGRSGWLRAGAQRRSGVDAVPGIRDRSEEHTSELQSPDQLVCRLLLEKKEYK